MAAGNENPKPVVTRGPPEKPKLLDQVKDLVVGGTCSRQSHLQLKNDSHTFG